MLRSRQNEIKPDREVDRIEDLPQPVVSYARELGQGDAFAYHRHKRAQLVYASRGVMTVTTHKNAYVIPPQRAVFMPSSIDHRIDANRTLSMRSLYIKPALVEALPSKSCVLQITPLLRELIITAVAGGNNYQSGSPQDRIMRVILDQITIAPLVPLALALPSDARLLQITQSLIKNPADSRVLGEWALKVGASKRTLNRLFTKQTGMTFQNWRQQLRLHRGIELLAAGESVTQVALALGYENTSAFIAMFRRNLGSTPSRYLRERNSSG